MGCLPQSASFKIIELDFLTFKLMRSYGPSCKRWRCSLQLLLHFPCWTWSITLNGNIAQSSLTSSSPPSLLSFVATFLFTDFPLCPDWELRQPIDPMQGARNLLSKSLYLPKTHSNWGSYAPFSRHCNLPRADFSTCISDVWDIAPPVGLQLYWSWMRWTENLMEILNIQLSCIVNLRTCAQNSWGLATSVLETWRCWWWCSKF